MQLNDFDLSQLLKFDPDRGKLMLGSDRMLLFRQEAFSFLRTLLLEQLGDRLCRAVLTQFGYRCGFGDFLALSKNFDWESEEERLACGPVMHTWEGIVHVTPRQMEFSRETGHFLFRGEWRNSYEAQIHRENFGPSDRPVCSSLTGYASGWCTAFFGSPVLAVESCCEGMGDDHCEWQILPVDAWDDEDEEAQDAKEALKATSVSIARDLERTVEERTVELRLALAKMEEQNQRLEELDRMKSEFLANVSHELRTPLTLILGPLESLLEEEALADAEALRPDLHRMLRSGHRLHRLVDKLLDFSRLEAGKAEVRLQPVDLCRYVASVVDDASSHAALRGVHIEFLARADLPPVLLDPEMLERILVNLVGNALKFTPSGGWVEVSVSREGREVVLDVTDTGPGIDPTLHEKVFERFQQVDSSSTREHEGTGLGLALVKEFTTLMDGRVSLKSALGRGARFRVHLPLRVAADEQAPGPPTARPRNLTTPRFEEIGAPAPRAVAPAPDSPCPRLLIAEDNADMREYLRELLTVDYEVVVAANGREALAAARQSLPDVVLSDVMMPEMDGLELVAALRGDPHLRATPIILLTAKTGSSEVVTGLDSGADDYLAKPFTPEELRARVRAAYRLATLHQELENVQGHLLRKERLAGIGQLIATVSHELRNPLGTIRNSFSSIKKEHEGEGGRISESIGRIERSIERCVRIVEELLEYARTREPHFGAVPLDRWLVDTVFPEFEIPPGVRFQYDLAAGVTLELEAERILQAMVNLATNAVQAMAGPNGTGEPAGELTVRTRLGDGQVEITVSDTGGGIDERDMPQVFEPLFSTKSFGVGLGLAHVKDTLVMHGGDAEIRSTPGAGTEVILHLPLSRAAIPHA